MIKDKTYILNKKISVLEALHMMGNKDIISGAKYNYILNVWVIPSTYSNMKIMCNLVQEKIEYHNWFKELIKVAKKKKLEQIKEKEKEVEEKGIHKTYPFLYKFQVDAIDKILKCDYDGFLIGNSMGTGKTIISLCCAFINNEENITIITPAPLMEQWKNEITKWFEKDSIILRGSKAKREKLYKELSTKKCIKIISYDTFKNDFKNIYLKKCMMNNYAIFDEATKIKNKKSLRYKAVKSYNNYFKFKLFLSGTPVSKSVVDIDNIIKLISKTITGNINDYLVWEEKKIGWGNNAKIFNVITGFKNLDVYVKKISPVYERKTLEQVKKDLPNKVIKRIDVKSTKFDTKIAALLEEVGTPFTRFSLSCMLASDIQNIYDSESEMVELIKDDLPDIPKNYSSPKLEQVGELVEEINDKILIFAKYISSTKVIKDYLSKKFKDKKIIIVDAGTKDKESIKNKFNETDEIDIVIATETWTEGVNLHNIDHLIQYDITPSVDKFLQKGDRIYRINSTRTKFIYNLVCGIEYHIMDLLETKLKLIEQITEGKAGIVNDIDIRKEVLKKLGWQ